MLEKGSSYAAYFDFARGNTASTYFGRCFSSFPTLESKSVSPSFDGFFEKKMMKNEIKLVSMSFFALSLLYKKNRNMQHTSTP